MSAAGSLPRHRLLILGLGLVPLLGFGPCSGTEDDDGGGSSPPAGTGSSVESLITCEVTLTVETVQIKSGSPNVLSPGDTLLYYFLDEFTVQGEGLVTLPTQSWSYSKTGSSSGTVYLDYGSIGTETYRFTFTSDTAGYFDSDNVLGSGSAVSYTGDFLLSCDDWSGGDGGSDGGGSSGCTNTCEYAYDGVCDDGGPGSSFSVCDYGTDCDDCGPRGDDGGSGSATCKQPCVDNSDCSPGEWCTGVADGFKCLPPECETECFANNLSCFSSNSTCEFEMCGDPDPDASDTCEQPCSSDQDCNAGEACLNSAEGYRCLPPTCEQCWAADQWCYWDGSTCDFSYCE